MEIIKARSLDKEDLAEIKSTLKEMFDKRATKSPAHEAFVAGAFDASIKVVTNTEKKESPILLIDEQDGSYKAASKYKAAWKRAQKREETNTCSSMSGFWAQKATRHALNYAKRISRALM